MSIDRRIFFKTAALIGASLTLGKTFGASAPEGGEVEFRGMLYDSTRCAGCQECEKVCAKAHGLPEPTETPEAGKIRKTSDTRRSVINAFTTANGEVYMKNQCMHCNEPACAAACLTEAMHKTKEGPVIWRGEKCMGCRYCMVSCPFDIPKFEYFSTNPKIQKCDLCYDRLLEGKIPVCAENCPAEALKFGTRRELIAEARKRIAENPGVYVDEIYGENVAGGTGFLYLAGAPFKELGMNTNLQNSSYPELTKSFLYSVPSVDVLLPPLLLGIYAATKNNHLKDEEDHD
ncbi:MAG: 4Fe-4S dicluster domain-containing protein [Candidatus Saccharibacteria bacterium]